MTAIMDSQRKRQKEFDVIIIGAGAAGLMCAAECGKRGRSVLVLDHAARTGSKIRISGGGRCNFTNLDVSADHYRSRNPHFCTSALARFTPDRMIRLVQEHGIAFHEKEAGQLFCRKSAKEITTMLERECERAGADILLDCRVDDVRKGDRFLIITSKSLFSAASLVVATGGLSYPDLGASSFGHDLAGRFGLAVVPPRPALVPFLFNRREQRTFRGCAGISLAVSVRCGGKRFIGNILFTHRGLSGPAALQASLFWERNEPIVIDLLPDVDILEFLRTTRERRREMRNVLAGLLPKGFVNAWCDDAIAAKAVNQCSDKELRELTDGLHCWKVLPAGTEGYETAEVTAGGVETEELSSKTMEAKKFPGLYFIGEVVDVTGELGGYNLHWAWASGYAAGQYA
jgi:hypothetical protein